MCGEPKPRSGPEGAGLPGAATERLSTAAEWPGYLPRSQHRRRCRHALGWRRSGGRSHGRRRKRRAARSVSACEPPPRWMAVCGRPNFRPEGRKKRTHLASVRCSLPGANRGRNSSLRPRISPPHSPHPLVIHSRRATDGASLHGTTPGSKFHPSLTLALPGRPRSVVRLG